MSDRLYPDLVLPMYTEGPTVNDANVVLWTATALLEQLGLDFDHVDISEAYKLVVLSGIHEDGDLEDDWFDDENFENDDDLDDEMYDDDCLYEEECVGDSDHEK